MPSCPMFCKQWLHGCETIALCMHVISYPLGPWLLCVVWASPWQAWLLRHRGYTGVTSWLCYMRLCHGYITVMSRLLLQLLRQIGDRLCQGCHASQERINMSAASAVPITPCVFFQPLSLSLATLDSAVRSVWTGLAIYYCLLLSLCARHWAKSFTFVI